MRAKKFLKIQSQLYMFHVLIHLNLVPGAIKQVQCENSLSQAKQSRTVAQATKAIVAAGKFRHHTDQGDTFGLNHIPERFSRPPIDGAPGGHKTATRRGQYYLPAGPPPFRPSAMVLALNSGLRKLKIPTIKLHMEQRRLYYTFLDIVRGLHRLADQMARGQVQITGAKLHLMQSLIGKLAAAGGKALKLKWPLVMLNPHFLKELLANPTFLVMLFHAIELASYSSASPLVATLLKPLVKLVKQPSPEQEERTWWRRKRLYETFNGIGSSELQPNLKTAHFRRPGEPALVSLPALSRLLPNFYDKRLLEPPKYRQPLQLPPPPPPQEPDQQLAIVGGDHSPPDEPHAWQQLMPVGEHQLLSEEEFEGLEESEKERIISEARRNLEESLWTNELIQRQNSLVESLQNKLDVGSDSMGDDVSGEPDRDEHYPEADAAQLTPQLDQNEPQAGAQQHQQQQQHSYRD